MAKSVANPSTLLSVNDVTSLFSQFGAFSGNRQYHELVREEAAINAACRWPLLAEIQGIDAANTDKAK
jgi:hypothetical protein